MYVAVARKHVRLMILLLCFCWLGALVFYVYSRPVYFSRALVKTDISDRNKTADQAFQEKARVAGIAAELTYPHIIERAAARLGVKASARDIQAHYIKKVTAKPNLEGNIEIEVYPYSFDWANRWSETLVREYLDYRMQKRKAELDQRIAEHAAERKQLIEMVEEDRKTIAGAKIENGLLSADINYRLLINTPGDIGDAKRKIAAIRRARVQLTSPDLDTVGRLSIISAVTAELEVGTVISPSPTTVILPSPAAEPNGESAPPSTAQQGPATPPANAPESTAQKQEPMVVVTPQTSTDSSWKDVVRDINIRQAKQEDLLRTYQPGHRLVMAEQDHIDALNLRLEGEMRTALLRLDNEYRLLLERLDHLEKQLPELLRVEQEFKRARDDQSLVSANMAGWLSQIRYIDNKIEQSRFAFDRDRVTLSFQNNTQINENPVSPNRLGLMIYATVLGLMLAIGIPFLIEYLDHTLSNMEEVEAAFQLRGLGIIPKIGNVEDSPRLLDHPESKESNILENFRVIRTNLLSMGSVSKPPHVVIVTSAMPKEGKTFVSSNLALSFAQTGAKTLLIDTDLRRGRLHRLFGYRKQPGLSGVLLDQVTLDEAIRPTPNENLFMLSAGQHLETGTELLGSEKFIGILDQLRKRFDRIVMDTPPVLGLSETSILQNHVDGVLFVIWSGQTPIKSVQAAIEILQANGANFYGFVLNRLDLSASANYYQYYYYSHDYYYQYTPRALENT